MGLINLQTNLRTVPWGERKPYITRDINNPPPSNVLAQQGIRRIDDTQRILKMIGDNPGRKFISNQALLLQTSIGNKVRDIKERDGRTTGGAILQQIGNTVSETAGTLASTIAQTPVSGTGIRVFKGITPKTYLQAGTNREGFPTFTSGDSVIGSQFVLSGRSENIPLTGKKAGTELSSVVKLRSTGITDKDGKELEEGSIKYINNKPPFLQQDDTVKNSYLGKTSVEDGIDTIKQRLQDVKQVSEEINTPKNSRPLESTAKSKLSPRDKKSEGLEGISYSEDQANTGSRERPVERVVSDFRKKTGKSYSLNYGSGGDSVRKESRVGLGNQGKKITIDPKKLWATVDRDTVDKLNELNIQDSKAKLEDSRDLISLNFEVITPDNTKYLYFRAYLDNFSDDYTGNWASLNYIGRGESMRAYEGFSRGVSLGFKVAASTRSEMRPIYEKINYLASATAPTYGDGTFMRGTIVRVTVGDYLHRVPAVLENVSFTWQVDYPWEISMANPEGKLDDDMQVLPHVLDCSVTLGIIHDFIPQTGKVPYIGNPVGNSRGKQVWTALPRETV